MNVDDDDNRANDYDLQDNNDSSDGDEGFDDCLYGGTIIQW